MVSYISINFYEKNEENYYSKIQIKQDESTTLIFKVALQTPKG